MSELYDLCRAQFETLNTSIKAKLADGRLSLRELSAICGEFARAATVIAEPLQVPGVDKKALVIEGARELWDKDLALLDVPGPDLLIDPMIRVTIPYLMGIAVDTVVFLYNALGWPTLLDVIPEADGPTESGTEVA